MAQRSLKPACGSSAPTPSSSRPTDAASLSSALRPVAGGARKLRPSASRARARRASPLATLFLSSLFGCGSRARVAENFHEGSRVASASVTPRLLQFALLMFYSDLRPPPRSPLRHGCRLRCSLVGVLALCGSAVLRRVFPRRSRQRWLWRRWARPQRAPRRLSLPATPGHPFSVTVLGAPTGGRLTACLLSFFSFFFFFAPLPCGAVRRLLPARGTLK